MSIFDSIKNAIFGRGSASTSTASKPAPGAAPNTTPPPATQQQPAPPASAPAPEAVDVEAMIEALAAKNPQKLNWRTSIVDLMKLLDLDSSFANRKALAPELGYTGDTGDSATMNIWLHAQVMKKLAASGGKVPASLKD